MIKNLYTAFETARNGTQIPVLYNNRTIESRYNPESEAQKLCSSIEKHYDFFLVLGLASGLFVKLLHETFPQSKIICIERSQQEINFLLQMQRVKKLYESENIIITDFSKLVPTLTQNYVPARYGDMKIIELRAWVNENSDILTFLQNNLKKALGIISADYSVQSHFGKIWQKNIMNNLKFLSENTFAKPFLSVLELTKSLKTAAVIAAGPTLEKAVLELKRNEDNYFIISTDTAFSTLLKSDIIPQAVISIDGQQVSSSHFINSKTKACFNHTVFFFDLCSNSSIAKNILQHNGRLIFFKSGHPLCELADINNNSIPKLFSGSGTVTIAATDLAVKLGFSNIKVFGADFSYINGKPYAKGTYLENIFTSRSTRLQNAEAKYLSLMYRTPLIQTGCKNYTTEILNAYKTSFEQYLSDNSLRFIKQNDCYELHSQHNQAHNLSVSSNFSVFSGQTFDYNSFLNKLQVNLNGLQKNNADFITALLPYIAWLRKTTGEIQFEKLLKLAQSDIVSYNKTS